MNIINFTADHVPQAMRLAQAAYDAERALVPALPDMRTPDLSSFTKTGMSVAAFEGERMLGFLCAYRPHKGAFGTNRDKQVYSPMHAHAAVGDTARVYRRMYQAAAEKWVNAGALSHCVTLYAHDEAAKQAWFTYGFGMRCIDAVRLIEPGEAVGDFLELPRERFGEIKDLRLALHRHEGESPYFLKRRFSPDNEEDARFFVARQGDRFAAYLKLRNNGETFASHAPDMMHICGVYAAPEARGTGLYANLLRYVETVLAEEGYARLGVDYESYNPNALYFYPKHFAVYTNAVVRRIDERGNR